MNLHSLFGTHRANPNGNHWHDGQFVSECLICRQAMVKPPGGDWALVKRERVR